MKQELVLFLAVFCVFGAAMVPRERREVTRCGKLTPCAWTPYKLSTKEMIDTVYNSYCQCPEGLQCTIGEDDATVGTYVHLCQSSSDAKSLLDDES